MESRTSFSVLKPYCIRWYDHINQSFFVPRKSQKMIVLPLTV